jgi:S-adenosyl-L-methionine hydrolase (adenosine-forming)
VSDGSPPAHRDQHPAVYFASDYGTADEFVGVVHAVLHRHAPGVPVIDLSHEVPAFDIAAGADLLVRCAPVLGSGVVLAVVDPGVGSARRAVAIGLIGSGAPDWLVGPDNGLLVPLAAAVGIREVREIDAEAARRRGWPALTDARTFDGRDLFGPAAAHLVAGGSPELLGPVLDPHTLTPALSPARPDLEPNGPSDGAGQAVLIKGVDRFGNVQLDLEPAELDRMVGAPDVDDDDDDEDELEVELEVEVDVAEGAGRPPGADPPWPGQRVRRVVAFADLEPGQVGLLADATGRLALVCDRASAAEALGRPAIGDRVHIRRARIPGAT